MIRTLIFTYLFLSMAALAQVNPGWQKVVDKVQKFYASTTSLTASFEQRYTHKIFKRTEKSTGLLSYQKPGQMRWDYKTPKEKAFVVDAKNLWIIDMPGKAAMVDKCFKQDQLTSAVAFLWGGGNLKKSFRIESVPLQFGEKGDVELALKPKVATGLYQKLTLVVDPQTGRVKQSVVMDMQGNINQFVFSDIKINAKLGAEIFKVKLAPDIAVTPLPGSCIENPQK